MQQVANSKKTKLNAQEQLEKDASLKELPNYV